MIVRLSMRKCRRCGCQQSPEDRHPQGLCDNCCHGSFSSCNCHPSDDRCFHEPHDCRSCPAA